VSGIAALIRSMAAAGAPSEAIALAVEAIEGASARDVERRRKQAERKRESRRLRDGHVTVQGQNGTVPGHDADMTGTPASPKDDEPCSVTVEDNQSPATPLSPPPGKSARAAKPDDGWPDGYFRIWYEAFPLHVDPGRAEPRLLAIRKAGKVRWETLMAATRRYAEECRGRERRFIKHPTTWLNAGSWENEPDLGYRVGVNGRGNEFAAAFDKLDARIAGRESAAPVYDGPELDLAAGKGLPGFAGRLV
jgi:hypothetical protein